MDYEVLQAQMESLLAGETDQVANLANASALLMDQLADINWAGFYLLKNGALILGPFQGKPACVHIPVGAGVCGTSFQRAETIRVPNVHDFPGHIACDGNSNSEIVIPLRDAQNHLIGVLDIDSPLFDRFSSEDQVALEGIARAIGQTLR